MMPAISVCDQCGDAHWADRPHSCQSEPRDDELMFDVCGNIGCDDGWVADCFDGLCVNAEDGCELCLRRCDWCNQHKVGEAA